MFDAHIFSHKQALGAHGGDVGGGNRSRFVKLDKPKLVENCSQQDFEFFTKEWKAYYFSSGMQLQLLRIWSKHDIVDFLKA